MKVWGADAKNGVPTGSWVDGVGEWGAGGHADGACDLGVDAAREGELHVRRGTFVYTANRVAAQFS